MSLEALALQLLLQLAPMAVEALRAALDTGASEAEALAAARAHLPARIDTATEDAERRQRIAARHGFDPESIITARDITTRLAAFGRRDTEPPPSIEADHVDALRMLVASGPLRSRELRAVQWALAALDVDRAGNGG